MDKKLSIDSLVGQAIIGYSSDDYSITLNLADGRTCQIVLEDEGYGGNDSRVSFGKIDLSAIVLQLILETEESDKSTFGAILKLSTKRNQGSIEIIHEHNGYYGWGYELIFK